MEYEYDAEVDGLYIWFVNNIEAEKTNYENEIWPIELKNEIGMLFDKNGHLMGIEILPASNFFTHEKLNEMSKKKI